MSLEKRKKVYELAKRYGVLILEDNPYGDLRFEGEDLPCIKSFDEDGLVIYAGTFSKVLAPGIRVGYCVGPAAVCQKMIVCKQGEDVHYQYPCPDDRQRVYDQIRLSGPYSIPAGSVPEKGKIRHGADGPVSAAQDHL